MSHAIECHSRIGQEKLCIMTIDPASPPPLEPNGPQAQEPESGRWLVFFIALLAPAVLTAGTAKSTASFGAVSMFLGSPIAGIVCAAVIPLPTRWTASARAAVRVGLAVVFTVVSLVLCFAGCVAASK